MSEVLQPKQEKPKSFLRRNSERIRKGAGFVGIVIGTGGAIGGTIETVDDPTKGLIIAGVGTAIYILGLCAFSGGFGGNGGDTIHPVS